MRGLVTMDGRTSFLLYSHTGRNKKLLFHHQNAIVCTNIKKEQHKEQWEIKKESVFLHRN